MSLSFSHFELEIDETILQRGMDYHEQGNVKNLKKDLYTWKAKLRGSSVYETEISIVEDLVESWSCTCPYDHGPVCKHVVAMLFAIREMEESQDAIEEKGRPSSRKKRTGKKKDPVSEIMEAMTEAELRKELHKLATEYDEIKAYLLSNYGHYHDGDSKATYKKIIKSLIKSSQGPYKFIDYRHSNYLGREVHDLLQNYSGNEKNLVSLCEVIISEMSKAVAHADDSNGEMAHAINEAFDRLAQLLTTIETATPISSRVFKLALSEHSKAHYAGWDWAGTWRSLCLHAVRTPKEAEKCLIMLEDFIPQQELRDRQKAYFRGSFSFSYEQAVVLKWELLNKWGEGESQAFLEKNLHLSKIREIAIVQAMDAQDYPRAKQLMMEGIKQDTDLRLPGLVSRWKDWLIRLAKIEDDPNGLLLLTEERFLANQKMEDYRGLKKLIPAELFNSKKEEWIDAFRQRKMNQGKLSSFPHEVAQIYLEEGQHDKIMALVKEIPSIHVLETYEKHLVDAYPDELIVLYHAEALKLMDKEFRGRKEYRKACKYLGKIASWGGEEQVRAIVKEWRTQYPRRKSLMDELNKHGWG